MLFATIDDDDVQSLMVESFLIKLEMKKWNTRVQLFGFDYIDHQFLYVYQMVAVEGEHELHSHIVESHFRAALNILLWIDVDHCML